MRCRPTKAASTVKSPVRLSHRFFLKYSESFNTSILCTLRCVDGHASRKIQRGTIQLEEELVFVSQICTVKGSSLL